MCDWVVLCAAGLRGRRMGAMVSAVVWDGVYGGCSELLSGVRCKAGEGGF